MNILVISGDRFVVSSLRESLSRDCHTVTETGDGKSALALVESGSPDLVVLDLRLPDTDVLNLFRTVQGLAQGIAPFPVVVIPAHATVDPAIEAMKLGATDYLASPFNPEDAAGIIRRALEAAPQGHASHARRVEHHDLGGLQDLIGNSKPMRGLAALVRCVSQSGASTVLLRGDSGTGKDLIAKAIHFESSRSHKPFMNITCTALQDTLLESELFGHERGSFTDAKT
ncbi:MAG: sigma 54-interacting transcriptional regulator, partial [Planctomycetes bacterium]|nr:sigma 54-interacting transcriptional regulator [Planctomycetota bacterium]